MKKNYSDTGVGIFAYNRPSHLKRLFISLSNHDLKNLYVFLDGPKTPLDKVNQDEIKIMIQNYPRKIKLIKRKKNLGLKRAISYGVNYLSKKHKKIIIIEDDCITFRNFFNFFNISFRLMEKDHQIEAICAYQHPNLSNKLKKYVNLKMNLFIPWGWGTLSSNWIKFQNYKESLILPKIYNNLKIKKNKKKTIWSLNYISYMYQKNKKCIYPSHSMIKNIGFDGSGVNSKNSNLFRVLENRIKLNSDCIYKKSISEYQKRFFKNKLKFFY